MIDPEERTVTVYTDPDKHTVFTESDTLDGGKILPGLPLPVQRIFAPLLATSTGSAK